MLAPACELNEAGPNVLTRVAFTNSRQRENCLAALARVKAAFFNCGVLLCVCEKNTVGHRLLGVRFREAVSNRLNSPALPGFVAVLPLSEAVNHFFGCHVTSPAARLVGSSNPLCALRKFRPTYEYRPCTISWSVNCTEPDRLTAAAGPLIWTASRLSPENSPAPSSACK